jgi:hypothetical protein
MTTQIYRDEIIRAVLGDRAHEGKVANMTRLTQIAERLAECESAQDILRKKGHGQAGTSIVDVAKAVPENAKQVLQNPFRSK